MIQIQLKNLQIQCMIILPKILIILNTLNNMQLYHQKNKIVDDINKNMLSIIPKESISYYSYDIIIPLIGNIDKLKLLYP